MMKAMIEVLLVVEDMVRFVLIKLKFWVNFKFEFPLGLD